MLSFWIQNISNTKKEKKVGIWIKRKAENIYLAWSQQKGTACPQQGFVRSSQQLLQPIVKTSECVILLFLVCLQFFSSCASCASHFFAFEGWLSSLNLAVDCGISGDWGLWRKHQSSLLPTRRSSMSISIASILFIVFISMSIYIAANILIVFIEEASIIIAANQEIINVNLHCLLPLYQELILVRQCNISFKVWDWKTTLKVTKMLHHLNITFSGEGANRASLETSNEKSNTAFSFCVRFSSAGVYHLPPPLSRNALCILLLGWRPCCIFNWWHSGLGCNSEYEC